MSDYPQSIDPDDHDYELYDRALWTFETKRFVVALFAAEEDCSPDDSFSDDRDVAFASDGDLSHWFYASVIVYGPDGEIWGSDHLGGCSHNSFREFYSAHRWQYSRRQGRFITDPKSRAWKACEARRPRRSDGSRADGHYFPQMVREALSQARAAQLRLTMVAA